VERWPLYYIDPETCIDCGACVNACPLHAIFPAEEVPFQYVARGGEVISKPVDTFGFSERYKGLDCNNQPILLFATRTMKAGEAFDFSDDVSANRDFFDQGPGYSSVAKK
jgi:ferredoxin